MTVLLTIDRSLFFFHYLVRFVYLLSFTCQFVSRTWCYRFSVLDCGSRSVILMQTALQSSVFEFLGMMEKPFIFDFDYMFWMEMVILLFNCFIHCSPLITFRIIYSYRNYRLWLRSTDLIHWNGNCFYMYLKKLLILRRRWKFILIQKFDSTFLKDISY